MQMSKSHALKADLSTIIPLTPEVKFCQVEVDCKEDHDTVRAPGQEHMSTGNLLLYKRSLRPDLTV